MSKIEIALDIGSCSPAAGRIGYHSTASSSFPEPAVRRRACDPRPPENDARKNHPLPSESGGTPLLGEGSDRGDLACHDQFSSLINGITETRAFYVIERKDAYPGQLFPDRLRSYRFEQRPDYCDDGEGPQHLAIRPPPEARNLHHRRRPHRPRLARLRSSRTSPPTRHYGRTLPVTRPTTWPSILSGKLWGTAPAEAGKLRQAHTEKHRLRCFEGYKDGLAREHSVAQVMPLVRWCPAAATLSVPSSKA
jgi:hypothetical protein